MGKKKDHAEMTNPPTNCDPKDLCPESNAPILLMSFKYTELEYVRRFNLAI